jgi:hypothetical protein
VKRGGWGEEREAGRVGCIFGNVGVAACLYREGDAVEASPAPVVKPESGGDAVMDGEIEVLPHPLLPPRPTPFEFPELMVYSVDLPSTPFEFLTLNPECCQR